MDKKWCFFRTLNDTWVRNILIGMKKNILYENGEGV